MLRNRFCSRFFTFACVVVVSTVVAFEVFAISALEDKLRKSSQFDFISKTSSFGTLIHSVAKYIHSKAAFLELIPYATPESDSRFSTWYLLPQQVVIEWMLYGIAFGLTFASGLPSGTMKGVHERVHSPFAWTLVIPTSATLLAVLYYKLRAWIELGEWFALVYLLQPCHVLVTGYTVLLIQLIRSGRASRTTNCILNTLFDLQWCSIVAIVLPDTQALLDRDFAGELFLFWFEHVLLVILPYLCVALFSTYDTVQAGLHRAWFSTCIFGLHHMHVMTPVSLIGGIQVNYQTHLPEYAISWFGKWYKEIVFLLALTINCGFALIVDPAFKWLISPRHKKLA